MSLQNILETSPILNWFHAAPTPTVHTEPVGHPSRKVIAYEADRGAQPQSQAANILSNLLLTADDAKFTEISLRKVRSGETVCFDRKPAGHLPADLGEAVARRMLFLSGHMEYSHKTASHQIHVSVRGSQQVWECRKRMDSVEIRRIS